MSQSDNLVIIAGVVVKGPLASFVGGDASKLRVKYQVNVPTRKKDNMQTFTPWVRSLGNQAKKDLENIKTGDFIMLTGRIVTRNEVKNRYLMLDGESNKYIEIDVNEDTNNDIDEDQIIVFEDHRMITEIQTIDVRYFNKFLSELDSEILKKLVSPNVLAKALEIQAKNQTLVIKEED